MQLLKSEGDSREKFVLVDLRRTDYEVRPPPLTQRDSANTMGTVS